MALNSFKCNHPMPLHFKGLRVHPWLLSISMMRWTGDTITARCMSSMPHLRHPCCVVGCTQTSSGVQRCRRRRRRNPLRLDALPLPLNARCRPLSAAVPGVAPFSSEAAGDTTCGWDSGAAGRRRTAFQKRSGAGLWPARLTCHQHLVI